jgi:hypothetical protein
MESEWSLFRDDANAPTHKVREKTQAFERARSGQKGRKPMSRKIELSFTGGGPGGGWNARVELRPFDGGFAVWAVDADERFREVSRWPRQLSWREAANALRATSQYGLQALGAEDGDGFFQGISVDGQVVPWQADMLRLAWVNYDDASDDVLEPLLKLDDDQIHELWSALGSFVEPAELGKLRQFVKLQEHYGLVGSGLIEHIAKERGLQKVPSYEDFLTMIASYLNTDEDARETALEPFAVNITKTTNRFSKTLDSPRSFITGMIYSRKTSALREYLEDYVLIFGKIPQGEHDVPGVGKIDLERLVPK